ncbi:hypothetical protein EJB05_04365, partial [Eragrostis curvula]
LKKQSKKHNTTMPMEQAFRHCDKDTLKMAMLKHEETFRQQVHELHRLYRIQKLLMRDLKRELKSQRNVSTSPNGGSIANHRGGALGVGLYSPYEQRYATRGGPVAAARPAPRPALSLDVVAPAAVEYVRSAEEDEDAEEETDDETELQLTLAVGGGGGGKKRYGEYPSGGESLSSSSTESDVLLAGQEWRQATARRVGGGSPCHFKRRPAAGLDVVQVEDGVGVQPPPPLRFHWLSLKMA